MRELNDEFRELLERTSVVEEMADTLGWAYLSDRAAHDIGAKQKRILGGVVTDLSEYKSIAGWLAGAQYILGLPERMRAEVETARAAQTDDAA